MKLEKFVLLFLSRNVRVDKTTRQHFGLETKLLGSYLHDVGTGTKAW